MSGKKAAASKEAKVPGHVSDSETEGEGESIAPPVKSKSKLKLLLLLVPVLLLLAGGGLCFTGIIKLPFLSKPKQVAVAQEQFVKIPEMITNLDAGPNGDSYAKMQAELEVPDAASALVVNTQMGAIVDLFQSYLRTMQPDDLRGAEGLYRLREALLARANVIVAPSVVQNVLFIELIIQ
jgi:flagellar FliL protein